MNRYKQRTKRHYSDDFRAQALTLLEAEGYPDNQGALTKVSRAFNVPLMTLYDWQVKDVNNVSTDTRAVQSASFQAVIEDEITRILEQMKVKRESASYRDLGIVAGILFDKLQLLQGMPTQRTEHTHVFTEADKVSAIQGYLDLAKQRQLGGMPPSDSPVPTGAHKQVVPTVPTVQGSVVSRVEIPTTMTDAATAAGIEHSSGDTLPATPHTPSDDPGLGGMPLTDFVDDGN